MDSITTPDDQRRELMAQGSTLYDYLTRVDPIIPGRKLAAARLNAILGNLECMGSDIPSVQYSRIQELPPELLMNIFQFATAEDPTIPFVLLMTCHSWRTLAENTSILWNKIIIDEGPDSLERAQVQLYYSKSAPLSIEIRNGRYRMISIMDRLLGGHFHRIVHFIWVSRPSVGVDRVPLSRYIPRMRNIVTLALDYPEPGFPSLIKTSTLLRRIDVQVASRNDLDELLAVVPQVLSLRWLTILLGPDYSDSGKLDSKIMAACPVESLVISSHIRHTGRFDIGPWMPSLLRIPHLRSLETHVPFLMIPTAPTLSTRPAETSPIRLLNLSVHTISSPHLLIQPIVDTVTSISISCNMEHAAAARTLRILSQVSNLTLFEWRGLRDQTYPLFVYSAFRLGKLRRLCFDVAHSGHLFLFLSIIAPHLEELVIGKGFDTINPTQAGEEVLSPLHTRLMGSPTLRVLDIKGILWPPMPTLYSKKVRLRSVSSLTVTISSFSALSSVSLRSDSGLYMKLLLTQAHNFYSRETDLSYFHNIHRLSLSIPGVRSLQKFPSIADFSSLLRSLTNLRAIQLPADTGVTPHIDTLCRSLRDEGVCPRLEEIESPHYPDWQLLLEAIVSRNLSPLLKSGEKLPVPLKVLSFPRQLHRSIHVPIQQALGGRFPDPILPWDLTEDL
ncbi:hypothetical protein FRC14_001177 [Serendipita sp. 396]|nr:hypothetical protein FRC14_001177 [Serendipita sp. 396]KAG8767525.1 hypothetical protein FRC15_005604 [Serendipita sp. 397]KAG8828491.1 hypothetical protein FRC19_003830 [Serendipita sp. 401]KAG8851052.1 hypothetical protein FRC20_001881 [Serendipita sp. 405]KAG9058134.1 hypothetical protein FS842_001318 [Serendipita sp. 407]